MAGLGSRVDNEVKRAFRLEETGNCQAVTDIKVVVVKMARRFSQAPQIPPGVPFRTEEVGPHVVVDPDNPACTAIKEGDELRPDEPA